MHNFASLNKISNSRNDKERQNIFTHLSRRYRILLCDWKLYTSYKLLFIFICASLRFLCGTCHCSQKQQIFSFGLDNYCREHLFIYWIHRILLFFESIFRKRAAIIFVSEIQIKDDKKP